VDVCLLTRSPEPSSWTELEYTKPPEVEELREALVHTRRFDPGPVEVPLKSCEGASLVLVRIVKKQKIVPPRNSLPSRRRPREPSSEAKAQGGSKKLQQKRPGSPAKRRYKALDLVGSGTFGKVFLAEEEEDEDETDKKRRKRPARKVALKRVSTQDDHKSREVELLKRINHPCVIALLDSYTDEDGSSTCIIMEYMPQNLHQRIAGQHLNVSDVRCFTFQLLRALAQLDGQSICHRDCKPENVLLQPSNRSLKLADFGSAKVLSSQASSSYICSRWWRAPELILGASRYTTSVDWWSCGCIAAEMMLGQPLFTGDSSWSQMYEIVRALGTPTLEEVKALHAGGEGRMAGHFSRLAELARPAKAWEDILPAFAAQPQALEIPAALLTFAPDMRQHPAQSMRNSFFKALPLDDGPLPPKLFDFTECELSSCSPQDREELLALAKSPLADGKRQLEMEDGSRLKRPRTDNSIIDPGSPTPPPLVIRLTSEDLADIP